jgi:hypothetical protein
VFLEQHHVVSGCQRKASQCGSHLSYPILFNAENMIQLLCFLNLKWKSWVWDYSCDTQRGILFFFFCFMSIQCTNFPIYLRSFYLIYFNSMPFWRGIILKWVRHNVFDILPKIYLYGKIIIS